MLAGVGLPLHGQDITPQTTPVQAGLAFAIPKTRRTGGERAGGFPGAETVLAQAFASGQMHHAWLIRGPEGIGKAAARIERETGLKVLRFPKLHEFFIGFRVAA